MLIEQLQPGDILLFSAEKHSFSSWAITWLTNAPVSHAAMFYDISKQSIIEESPPAVEINDAKKRFIDRTIYVRRLKEDLPMQPVLTQARSYLNDIAPYDNAGFYTIGILLLYKKFSANSHAQKIIIKILKKLSHSITEYINQHKFPGKLPLVCSQFVAECYDNAGEAYQLKFDQPTVASNEAANKANTHNFPQKNLLQHALDSKQTFSASNSKARTGTPEVITEALEDLCQALQQAVQAGNIVLEGISNPSDAAAPSNELLTAAADLAQAHHQASHISKGNQTVFLATGQQSINFMLEDNYHNFFTFPGDLLLHCPSLEDIGIIGG